MPDNRLSSLLVLVLLVPSLVLVSLVPQLDAMSSSELEVWRTECPYNDYCTMDSTQRPNLTHHPCCSQCSCDADCWVLENCCPDSLETQIKDTGPRANCRTMCLDTTDPKLLSDCRLNFPWYRVLDFCPPEFGDLDPLTKDKCEGRLADELEDVVAVSDAKSRIYMNKHCAKCHGVQETMSWILELHDCAEDISSLTGSQYLPAILDHCLIASGPPGGSSARFHGMLCGPNLFSTCTSSVSNDDNVDRCINGPYIPYQHQKERRILTFKNVFCFLCSREDELQHMCLVSQSEVVKHNYLTLNVLLDIKVDTAIRAKLSKEHRCGETDLYDHVKDRCVRVFCPPYSLAVFGDCVSMDLAVYKYPYLLQIVYIPTQTHFFPETIQLYDAELSQKYVDNSLRAYELSRCDVNEFSVEAYVEKKTSMLAFIVVKVLVVSDDECDRDYISELAKTRLSVRRDISVLINGQTVGMSGQISFYKKGGLNNPLYSTNTFIFVYQTRRTRETFEFFLCPHFKIGADEYNTVTTEIFRDGRDRNISDLSERTQVEEGFYVLNNDSIAVCTDTYFKLYGANEATNTLESTDLIFLWAIGYMLIYSSLYDLL